MDVSLHNLESWAISFLHSLSGHAQSKSAVQSVVVVVACYVVISVSSSPLLE